MPAQPGQSNFGRTLRLVRAANRDVRLSLRRPLKKDALGRSLERRSGGRERRDSVPVPRSRVSSDGAAGGPQ